MKMASPTYYNFPPSLPYQPPPPPAAKPPPPLPPPPPPPPPPPSPSPSSHTTVIVVVFVSFGGILFHACIAAAFRCFLKKRTKMSVQETEVVHVDEHLKVKEDIVTGPHGMEVACLVVEDDAHVDEVIRKNEELGQGLHEKGSERKASGQLQVGASSLSASDHHHQFDQML